MTLWENLEQPNWESWTLDFELVHSLALAALIEDCPEFLSNLIPTMQGFRRCLIETKKRLYDLKVVMADSAAVFEIKVWSPLEPDQIARQVAGAIEANWRLFYILLGKTGADLSRTYIETKTNRLASKIGYRELIGALNPLTSMPLAAAYRDALIKQ
jgi:hypothetical protein